MAVKYVGGGGLFSSFLPSLLQLGGAALGGPVGAGIGGALGSAVGGGSVGDVLKSGIGGYLGQGGRLGRINAPAAAANNAGTVPQGLTNAGQNFVQQHLQNNAPDLAGFAAQDPMDEYYKRYGWNGGVFGPRGGW